MISVHLNIVYYNDIAEQRGHVVGGCPWKPNLGVSDKDNLAVVTARFFLELV